MLVASCSRVCSRCLQDPRSSREPPHRGSTVFRKTFLRSTISATVKWKPTAKVIHRDISRPFFYARTQRSHRFAFWIRIALRRGCVPARIFRHFENLIAAKILEPRVKMLLIDTYSRNYEINMKQRMQEINDYHDKSYYNFIRTHDELYTLFCSQLENFTVKMMVVTV